MLHILLLPKYCILHAHIWGWFTSVRHQQRKEGKKSMWVKCKLIATAPSRLPFIAWGTFVISIAPRNWNMQSQAVIMV